MVSSYKLSISHESEAPDWDAFLAETPGGHHVQTSLWAQVKASLGWSGARVVVMRGKQIIAGAQLLIRRLPVMGAIGYVAKGPLTTIINPELTKLIIDGLHQVAKLHRIQYLLLQPPHNDKIFTQQLPSWGFQPEPVSKFLNATTFIDLAQDLDTILAQMKSKTRYNIRLGQRKGITVREGTERDLSSFNHLLTATGHRQKFSSNSEEYFSEMWRVLNSHGYFKLFLAEYQNEAVSALLAIPFGDTVIYKRGAWSGRYGNLRPNEVMHWTALKWAKSRGYHYYDFDGIDPAAARALMQGESLPTSMTQTVTRFKLGFGGQVRILPGNYDCVYNPSLHWIYQSIYPKVANLSIVKNILNLIRYN